MKELKNDLLSANKGTGVDRISTEDLITMALCRLEHFQSCEGRCREYALAITKLDEALLWLGKRTMNRED